MKLSKAYEWLALEGAPRHLLKALELMGVTETVGPKHNPIILNWAKEVGLDNVYKSDEIAWCGLFAAVIMKRADRPVVESPLWALSWANFGVKVDVPMLGDVLTFKRKGGGHVGLYISEDDTCYHVLGGNQNNSVNIVRILKSRLFQARRPEYTNPPSNIRRIITKNNGKISENES